MDFSPLEPKLVISVHFWVKIGQNRVSDAKVFIFGHVSAQINVQNEFSNPTVYNMTVFGKVEISPYGGDLLKKGKF